MLKNSKELRNVIIRNISDSKENILEKGVLAGTPI